MASDFRLSSKSRIRSDDAASYRSTGRTLCAAERDLWQAHAPGVAEPCLQIAKDADQSYEYTARGNLVAVVTNGTAVLGLGDIGPYAAKPAMESKGVLFKRFADIDAFDLELATRDVDEFCACVKALEPAFGGIDLEDVKAPECFAIEERLRREMAIPVFHDGQHGTGIISGAALLNALEVAGKSIERVRVVVSGAGASAIACAKFYLALGAKPGNLIMVDTKGVIHKGRSEEVSPWKQAFAVETRCRTLQDALEGADVFLGLSAGGLVTERMVQSMAKNPIVFALANPAPEITYAEAKSARADVIVATGRSDFPNQVNNVLASPFIFRAALDVRAKAITDQMKLAAAKALAALAKEDAPESVSRPSGGRGFSFGPDYILPSPFDPRVMLWVAPAVAKAAIESGVARLSLDLNEYRERLRKLQSRSHQVMSTIYAKARQQPVRVVFPEGNEPKILQAAQILAEEGICAPILLGDSSAIRPLIEEQRLAELKDVKIIEPSTDENFDRYVAQYWDLRKRRGISMTEARKRMSACNYFAAMMIRNGLAEGMVTGLTMSYPEAIRAPLEIIRTKDEQRAGGVYIVVLKNDFKFFADCTVTIDPTAEELAEIAIRTADLARYFDVTPRIAMLSYSNFGSAAGPSPAKVARAAELVRIRRPDLEVDGEIQVDTATVSEVRLENFPFCRLTEDANVFVFPNLDAANIAYKLLWRLGGAEVIGPVLLGMHRPVNVLQTSASVADIVNLAAVTVLRAQGEFAF